MANKDYILQKITDFYLKLSDFNGFPVWVFDRDPKLMEGELEDSLISLMRDDKIYLNFGDSHPNMHIKAFQEETKERQIERLQSASSRHYCAYPSRSHLKQIVDPLDYQGRPFTLRLALGEPQLSYESFDLSVLEFYRNDPRYTYSNTDIYGSIIFRSEHNGPAGMPQSDKIYLKTFGFSYDSDLNRAVAVFLIYLSKLSPEHQQMWNAKVIKGKYKLHPDYYRTSIRGRFQERISVFDAFIWELKCINEMCDLIGRPPLFQNDLSGHEKPRSFCFLIRPTLKEYYDFIHTLDKLISENINRNFFLSEVCFEHEEARSDGKIVIRQKGTIQILDEWLKLMFIANDRQSVEEMISTFKEIRRLRQRPAHVIDDNVFDQKYLRQQREIIKRAYKGIRSLRLIFANHPNTEQYEVSDYIRSGKIWTY